MIAIVDYDAGNIKSVEKALKSLGQEVVVTSEKAVIEQALGIILPGVGAFGDAMENLRRLSLDRVLKEVVKNQIPLLGICVGMQLLFEKSEESPGIPGLGILEGEIRKIPGGDGYKIPHMGWNSLEYPSLGRLFAGLREKPYVYFVHSYYLQAKDPSIVKAVTEYSTVIHAAVEKDRIFACQFHPEKSSDTGLAILKNFIDVCREEC